MIWLSHGQVFRSALTPYSSFNLATVFVKDGNQPSVFSAKNDDSSRPVNASRFVLVFPYGGDLQVQVRLDIVIKLVNFPLEYPV